VRRLAFFVALAWALSPFAHTCEAAREIDFESRGGMIWLNVSVQGRTEPLRFLLDSGASATVLDLAAARRLGMKLGAGGMVQGVQGRCVAYRAKGLIATAGGIPIAAAPLALDLGPVSRSCGRRIDGLLGADFFRERTVQIDYAAGKLRLLAPGEAVAKARESLPLAVRNGALCVRVGVDGHAPEWMRVDTGCASALEWVSTSTRGGKAPGTSIAPAAGSARTMAADVVLGAEVIPGVRVGIHAEPIFPGEYGLVGNELLSRYRVTFDLRKNRLFLGSR
jgi:hypothetical protein